LLIKTGAFVAAGPEAITADRREMTPISLLLLHQPAERSQSNFHDITSGSPISTEYHRLRKSRIIVSRYRLKPHPIIRGMGTKQLDQAFGEDFTQLIRASIAGEGTQIFLNGE
jgi:hypothetical protein